eukprot:55179-Eustigmatos_ZCMA.PRE.1
MPTQVQQARPDDESASDNASSVISVVFLSVGPEHSRARSAHARFLTRVTFMCLKSAASCTSIDLSCTQMTSTAPDRDTFRPTHSLSLL